MYNIWTLQVYLYFSILTIIDQESLKPDFLSPGHAFPKISKNEEKLIELSFKILLFYLIYIFQDYK